jgi:hypothetical protein
MIDETSRIPDSLSDEIGQALGELRAAAAGKALEIAREALVELGHDAEYIFFEGNCNRYGLHRIGESYLYKVPENKRGHLSVFRGKLVRLACWHRGGQYNRRLMAGIVDESQRGTVTH